MSRVYDRSDQHNDHRRAVWRRSKWLNRSRIDHGESKAWRAAIFKVYVTAYRRTGNASPGTKRVIAGSPVLHLFHDRRELSTTRDAVWRAFMWNSPMYLPCVNIYMYVCIYVYTCAWRFFFLFETVFRDLSSQTVDSIKGNWSSLLTIDGRFCHQLIAKWWMWNCILYFWHWAGIGNKRRYGVI